MVSPRRTTFGFDQNLYFLGRIVSIFNPATLIKNKDVLFLCLHTRHANQIISCNIMQLLLFQTELILYMETVFQAMGSSSQLVKTAEDAFCGTGRAVKSRKSSKSLNRLFSVWTKRAKRNMAHTNCTSRMVINTHQKTLISYVVQLLH